MKNKPKFINKKSCIIDKSVEFGKNVTIYPNNIILGESVINDGTTLKSGNYIDNSIIGEKCLIEQSHLSFAEIGNHCTVGPFARIRPGTFIEENVKIGNFVEVKNSTIKSGTKASHLAYIGDADIGANCNIGCGVIFANYNGKKKFRTNVGDNCFIGSNSNIIAPVTIANNCYICAGTTLTQDTNENDFVIARERETIKPNRAQNYLNVKTNQQVPLVKPKEKQ